MTLTALLRQPLPLAILLIALPTLALANVPIFFVFAGVRITFWWTVLLAIAIEAAALYAFFGLSARKAVWAALLINIGTAFLGFVIYPFVGLVSYPVLAPIVTETFGTGQIVEIAAYCVAAAVIDTPIELVLLMVLSSAAGYGVKVGRKAALVFFIANLISASVLFAAIQIGPRQAPVGAATQEMIETRFGDEVTFVKRVFEELPQHIDEEGQVDPQWYAALEQEAEALTFLGLEIGTPWGLYPIVPMPLPEMGEMFMYDYQQDRYDGAAKVTRGTIERYSSKDLAVSETMRVLHYQLWNEDAEPRHSVRAILLLSDGT